MTKMAICSALSTARAGFRYDVFIRSYEKYWNGNEIDNVINVGYLTGFCFKNW